MKLVSIYSNKEDYFPRIEFNRGFNVIFAQVESPEEKEKDSHNLGKTLLITVIDFGLLGGVGKDHLFKDHAELFSDFTFYLEIETNYNRYITVKRKVSGNKSISIHVSNTSNQKLEHLSDDRWQHTSLGLESARSTLNDLVNLSAIEPYGYRKGLGYVLRRQSDYEEVFRISKFRYNADKDWKPFVATLLGFDHDLIKQKYDLEGRVSGLESARNVIEREAGSKKEEFDQVRGEIELKSAAIERMRNNVENFSFVEFESEINERVVVEIETRLSGLNERRYVIDYEVQEIQKSMDRGFEFDVEKIQSIFEEAQIIFPENLRRDYDELVEFNRRLSTSRIERLRILGEKLIAERREVQASIEYLDNERQEALHILREKETFDKYKRIQQRLSDQNRELASLEQRLEQLSRATSIQKEINEEQKNIDDLVEQINTSVRGENLKYSVIRRTFSEYVERVLNVQALLYVNVNQAGNLEFNVKTLSETSDNNETSEGKGTSYRKILCACFDLTLLSVYAEASFYRFVYHDGIFEGLDNRKKVNLLDLIREICEEKEIQYTLTVIDSDLPRDSIDQKLLFTDSDIVRRLHDKDETGRLFRMPAF